MKVVVINCGGRGTVLTSQELTVSGGSLPGGNTVLAGQGTFWLKSS